MVRLSVKLSPALVAKLDALTRRTGQSRSDIVREAIERAFKAEDEANPFSALDLLLDLKGAGIGSNDLSSRESTE